MNAAAKVKKSFSNDGIKTEFKKCAFSYVIIFLVFSLSDIAMPAAVFASAAMLRLLKKNEYPNAVADIVSVIALMLVLLLYIGHDRLHPMLYMAAMMISILIYKAYLSKMKNVEQSDFIDLFSAGLLCCVCEFMQYNFVKYISNWGVFFTLTVLMLLFTVCTVELFGIKRKTSQLIIGNMVFVLALANFFVISFQGNAFILSDIIKAATAMSVISGYSISAEMYLRLAVFAVCVIAYNYVIIRYGKKDYVKFHSKIKYTAPMIVGLAVLAAIYVFNGAEFNKYRSNYTNGYLLNLLLYLGTDVSEPKNVDAFSYDFSDEAITPATGDAQSRPNIIAVMDESFSDLSMISDIDTNRDYLPYFRELCRNSTSGTAYSSVFGGNTCTSEFEFFTGISSAFSTSGGNVYGKYSYDGMPSIVSVLENNGYSSLAIHPFLASNYNRENVYQNLGFDRFISDKDFTEPQMLRGHITDEECFDRVISEYENREQGTPFFCWALTMQNHADYNEDMSEILPEDELISAGIDGRTDLDTYLTVLKKSDDAIRKLTEYFEKVDEPTIIIIFGDHQPCCFSNIAGEGDDLESAQYQFKVPYLLWSNYELEGFEAPKTDISINYLGAMLLDAAGIESKWFDFIGEMRRDYPVITENLIVDADGTLTASEKITSVLNDTTDFSDKERRLKIYQVYCYKRLKNT